MIVGLGIDVVDVARFAGALARPGVRERLFTDAELAGLDGLPSERAAERGAGRFAAKEALAKALGGPTGLSWTDVEVLGERPAIRVFGTVAARAEELGVASYHVSITHDAGVAAAVVVLEG